MKVTGSKKEMIEVEIDPVSVVQALFVNWLKSIGMSPSNFYLMNETWREDDPSNNAYSSDPIVRQATVEEIEIYNSFKLIIEVARNSL